MNVRVTIALVAAIVIVVLVGFFFVNRLGDDTPDLVRPRRDFFYIVDDDDINLINVTHLGESGLWVVDSERGWHFDTPEGEPVHLDRWGGVTLLLSGPQYKRVISDRATDLARYGLEDPPTIIKVGLQDIGEVRIRVGDKTPDGDSNYVQYHTDESIYLVDSTWGDVMARLVTEPPYIPTPTPEPTETPEGGEEASGGAEDGSSSSSEGTPAPSPAPSS